MLSTAPSADSSGMQVSSEAAALVKAQKPTQSRRREFGEGGVCCVDCKLAA